MTSTFLVYAKRGAYVAIGLYVATLISLTLATDLWSGL